MKNLIINNVPLCVDLDGTLLKTDLLFESIIYLLKKNFFFVLLIPFWFIKGRYFVKFKLMEYVSPTVVSLPYNKEIIDFILEEKKFGRKIILVTATAKPLADKVANHLLLFDDVLGSENNINLVAEEKSNLLVEKYGKGGFDYIGDSWKDLKVFENSNVAYLVTNDQKLIEETRKISNLGKVFSIPKESIGIFIKQIRIHQWTKNLLLLLPPILAHKSNLDNYISTFYGFAAFSFIASTIYIINDLADIESDRNHPVKKDRPLASGNLKVISALKIIPVLFLIGFSLSYFMISLEFTLLLLLYTIITVLYSFKFKKQYLLDMIVLSLLYTLRLIAGGNASNTDISTWLFSFSLFLFISLGALKRYTELKGLLLNNKSKTRGRDYYVEDIPLIINLGIASGIVSTLVFTLYINNPEVITLYKNSSYLYLISPVVFYWIVRLWFLAHRGQMNEDPILFAVKDKISYFALLLIIIISVISTL